MVRTVLLVDDQPEFLDLARAILSEIEGLAVVGEATNGPDALLLAAELRPEAVLLDVQMPGMNGFEVARRLIAASPRQRVVLTSNSNDPSFSRLARAVGARAYLSKLAFSAAEVLGALGWIEAVPARRPLRSRGPA